MAPEAVDEAGLPPGVDRRADPFKVFPYDDEDIPETSCTTVS